MKRNLILASTMVAAALGVAAPGADAAYPGTNGDILFGAVDRDDHSGLFETSIGGTPKLLRSTGFDVPYSTDVSPDGTRVLWFTPNNKIWVADRDGSDARMLTPEEGSDRMPSWSPDGRTITFSEEDRETSDWYLMKMNADGTGRTRIGDDIEGLQPVLSPDGRKLAYSTWDWETAGEIVIINADGTGSREPITEGEDPEWTPDGRALVFGRYDYEYAFALYRLDVASEDVTAITVEGEDTLYARPSVSPDGKKIVAMSGSYEQGENRGGPLRLALRTMDIDGSNVEVLQGTESAIDPDWAPGPPVPVDDEHEQGGAPHLPQTQTQAQTTAAPRASAPSASARVCGSRRFFTIHVRGGRLRKVGIVLGKKRLKVGRKGRTFTARVDLRRLPKGTFTVRISKTLKGGGVRKETRRYRTCVPKKA